MRQITETQEQTPTKNTQPKFEDLLEEICFCVSPFRHPSFLLHLEQLFLSLFVFVCVCVALSVFFVVFLLVAMFPVGRKENGNVCCNGQNYYGNYLFFSYLQQSGVENIPTTVLFLARDILSCSNLQLDRDVCTHTIRFYRLHTAT